MARIQLDGFLQHVRAATCLIGLTDGQLMDSFVDWKDQAAFAALLRRHGPMVLGVCRRVLPNLHDAEDAFQATFLVLVRKAASVRPRCQVGNWLYGVAHRTALRAHALSAQRRTREKQVSTLPEPAMKQPGCIDDLRPVLDRELARLPEKYRTAVVLCDLQGKTYREAARQLGWPVGTVSTCLTRARGLLAKRLRQHGLMLPTGTLAASLAREGASASVPPPLHALTTRAAAARMGPSGLAGISKTALTLAEGVSQAMWLTKQKMIVAMLLAGSCLASGLVFWGPPTRATAGAKTQPEALLVLASQDADRPSTGAGKLEDTLLDLEKQTYEALKKEDIDTQKKLTADDFVAILGDGSRHDKESYFRELTVFRLKTYSLKDVRVVQLTSEVATLTYRVKSAYTILGLPMTDEVSASSTWVRRDGKWLNVLYQETEVEP